MPKLLVIQHHPMEGLGTFEEELKAQNLSHETVKIYENPRFPGGNEFDAYAGLISMGGPMGANEEAKYPWMKKELLTIKEFLRQKKPILGVCLGAQLLARASGGHVVKAKVREIGWYPVQLDDWFSRRNPLFFQFEQGKELMVFQWHEEACEISTEAYTLCTNNNCRQQAFSFQGNAFGLQFHPEVTETMIRQWLEVNAVMLRQSGIDTGKILAESIKYLPELKKIGHKIFYGFGSLIRDNRKAA